VKSLQFEVGSFVWYFSPRKTPGLCDKWQLRTSGLYRVERRANQVNYVIRRSPKAKPFICHIDRMRKFVGDLPMHWKGTLENIPVQNIPERQRNVPLPENVPTPNVPPPANNVPAQPENIPAPRSVLPPRDNVQTPSGNIPRREQPTRNKRRPVRFM